MAVPFRLPAVVLVLALATPAFAQARPERVDPVHVLKRASQALRAGNVDAAGQARIAEALARAAQQLAAEREAAKARQAKVREMIEKVERRGTEMREQLRQMSGRLGELQHQREQMEPQREPEVDRLRRMMEGLRAAGLKRVEQERETAPEPEHAEPKDEDARLGAILERLRAVKEGQAAPAPEHQHEAEVEIVIPDGGDAMRVRRIRAPIEVPARPAPPPDLGDQLMKLQRAVRELNARVQKLEHGDQPAPALKRRHRPDA